MMNFQEDTGFVKLPDEKGERIYNFEFVPTFVKRVSDLAEEAQKTGNREKLEKFLEPANVEAYARSFRNQQEMARDKAFTEGQVQGERGAVPNEPVPAAPQGVNPTAWVPVIREHLPLTASGRPWPMARWAAVVEDLRADPSPEAKADFDAHFAKTGITADAVLQKLGSPQAAAKPAAAGGAAVAGGEAAKPAAAAAPEAPTAPAAPAKPAPKTR